MFTCKLARQIYHAQNPTHTYVHPPTPTAHTHHTPHTQTHKKPNMVKNIQPNTPTAILLGQTTHILVTCILERKMCYVHIWRDNHSHTYTHTCGAQTGTDDAKVQA
eukprot:GDKI01027622.1.p1 GENE.GDKI01027622.1~~GDKI01027622.1.p1  ORF type:complete len:106 (-),score=24.04 GDKI01027622.1:408-725(-)